LAGLKDFKKTTLNLGHGRHLASIQLVAYNIYRKIKQNKN